MPEENVHQVSRDQWVQLAVGLCVTVVLGLIAYVVNLTNQQVGNTIGLLQASDKIIIERLTELEKQSSYVLAKRVDNERRFQRLEKDYESLQRQVGELRARR